MAALALLMLAACSHEEKESSNPNSPIGDCLDTSNSNNIKFADCSDAHATVKIVAEPTYVQDQQCNNAYTCPPGPQRYGHYECGQGRLLELTRTGGNSPGLKSHYCVVGLHPTQTPTTAAAPNPSVNLVIDGQAHPLAGQVECYRGGADPGLSITICAAVGSGQRGFTANFFNRHGVATDMYRLWLPEHNGMNDLQGGYRVPGGWPKPEVINPSSDDQYYHGLTVRIAGNAKQGGDFASPSVPTVSFSVTLTCK